MRVRTRGGPAFESIANCDGCEWGEIEEGHTFGRDVQGQAQRARRHVEKTGHKVTLVRSTAVVVEPA